MNFEKINSGLIVTPKSQCSGCSDDGKEVYKTNHTPQVTTNANRCTAK